MKLFLMLLLIFTFASCSGGQSTDDTGEEDTGIELSDSDEFGESDEFGDDEFKEESTDAISAETSEEKSDDFGDDEFSEDSASKDSSEQAQAVVVNTAEEQVYVVQKNETLMMIAFKLYGDYSKWKDIYNHNALSSTSLAAGQNLKYMPPAQPFEWNPEGNPYLIKKNDTLGLISNDVYGTKKYWKNIWKNNTPLIKDPNIIFAGFTIYTPVIDRDLASN